MRSQACKDSLLNTIAISWIPFYATADNQQYAVGKKLLEEQLTILELSPMDFAKCFVKWIELPFRFRRYYMEIYKENFGVPLTGKTRGEVITEDVIKLSRSPLLDRTFIRTIMERR